MVIPAAPATSAAAPAISGAAAAVGAEIVVAAEHIQQSGGCGWEGEARHRDPFGGPLVEEPLVLVLDRVLLLHSMEMLVLALMLVLVLLVLLRLLPLNLMLLLHLPPALLALLLIVLMETLGAAAILS